MILIDTGYLVALIDSRDQLHRTSMAWARVIAENVLVTDYVLLEAVNYFSGLSMRSKVHVMLDYMKAKTDCVIVTASPDLFEAGIVMHRQRRDQEWSLTDCISFHIMQERGIDRALAYDHHFEQAGFVALLRTNPA